MQLADLPQWIIEIGHSSSGEHGELDPDFEDVFTRAGWTPVKFNTRGEANWTRPGKDPREGHSATVYPRPDSKCIVWSDAPELEAVPKRVPLSPIALARHLGVPPPRRHDEPPSPAQQNFQPSSTKHLTAIFMEKLETERQQWLWRGWLPLGGLSLLVGQEGLGKSTVACQLTAQVSTGSLPGDLFGRPAGVIFVTAEDSETAVIRPRLIAAGADLSRVAVVRVDEMQTGLSLPYHLDELTELMIEHGARLLVLDPLSIHLGDEHMDSHRERDVRRAIAPVAMAMADIGAVALGVMHWSKNTTTVAVDRVLGSRAFSAAARSIVGIGEDREDRTKRVLVLVKSNLGRLDIAAKNFSIEQRWINGPDGQKDLETSGITWHQDKPGLRGSDLFNTRSFDGEQSQLAKAMELVSEMLASGPIDRRFLDRAAKAHDIGNRTMERARAALHVQPHEVRDDKGRFTHFEVSLPEDDEPLRQEDEPPRQEDE